MQLIIYEMVDLIFLGEPLYHSLLMLPNPFTKVAGDPDIQCTVSSASQNIEGWLLRKHTGKWIPVVTGMTECAAGFTIHGMTECAPGFFSTGTVVIPA